MTDDSGTSAIEVIVRLTPEAAAPNTAPHEKLRARVAQLGIPLAPLHPSTSDPDLAAYAVAHVDPDALTAVVEQLLACDGVEGAYAKAPGSPPERSVHDAQKT